MKNKNLFSANTVLKTIIVFMALLNIKCSDSPIENEPIDKEPCPPVQTVPQIPYDDPIWHPSGEFIGFNYTPLDSIAYPYGDHCEGMQYFDYESAGFYLINPDGSNQRRVLDYFLYTPAWSPDGNWIAFVARGQILKMPFINGEFDTTQIISLTNEGNNFYPAWSPDGNWIAFDSNNLSNGMYFIWKMRSDGSNKNRLVYAPDKGEIRGPNWSPDGKTILHIRYSLDFNSYAPEVCVMDTNGSNFRRLTFNDDWDENPKYSKDINLVSFIQRNNGQEIMLMNLSNENSNKLTTEGVSDSYCWNNEGNRIVYVKYKSTDWSDKNGTLWIVDVKTGMKFQLTYN